MIIGPDTVSDGPNGRKLSDITKGTTQTIAIVETTHPVCWMAPEDLPKEALKKGVRNARGATEPGVGSYHPNIAHVGMLDGSVTPLYTDADPQDLFLMSKVGLVESNEPVREQEEDVIF